MPRPSPWVGLCYGPGLPGPAQPILWVVLGRAGPVIAVNVPCQPMAWVFSCWAVPGMDVPTQFTALTAPCKLDHMNIVFFFFPGTSWNPIHDPFHAGYAYLFNALLEATIIFHCKKWEYFSYQSQQLTLHAPIKEQYYMLSKHNTTSSVDLTAYI